MVTLSFLGILFSNYSPFRMFWTADTSFVSLFFYYAGYAAKNEPIVRKCYEGFLEKKKAFHIVLFAINLMLIFNTAYVNLRSATYPNALLFYFNAIVSILLYLSVCYSLSNINLPVINIVKKWLCYLGENTIGYLCLNELIIKILKNYLPHSNTIERLVLLALCMVVLTLITKILLRAPLRVFIGK